jgi:hypothetical protein
MEPIYALVLLINMGVGDEIVPFSFDVGRQYHNRAACLHVLKRKVRKARKGMYGDRPIGGACIVMKGDPR